MSDEVRGKKLLLLGGVKSACEIVRVAHKMGVLVYVTDYLEDSPAKKIADKSFMVSATDVDAVVALCEREKIDGVITGYVDMLLPYAEEICRKLKKPFWGNQENIATCIDKYKFKLACEKAGVPVVPWKRVTAENYLDGHGLSYPLVVKPVDNSGGRGIFRCYSDEEYRTFCQKALEFSRKGELLVERMMDLEGEISAYYMLYHGKAYLSGMCDKRGLTLPDSSISLCQGTLFPSEKLPQWQNKMTACMENFFRQNEMKDGFVFIQGFCEGEEFYVHEIGYRLNGGYSYRFTEYFSGYNQIEQLILYALTGTMDTEALEKSDPAFNGFGAVVVIMRKPGKKVKTVGLDEIRNVPGVLAVYKMDTDIVNIQENGEYAKEIACILCVADDRNALKSLFSRIRSEVQVMDADGNSLLYDIMRI